MSRGALALVLAGCAAPAPEWRPFRGKPPPEVVVPHEGLEAFGWVLEFEGGVSARFHHASYKQEVLVLWERGGERGEAVLPTEYLPTTLLAPTRDTLLVAGKRDDGRTVIELWTFDASVLPPRRSATVLHDEARAGRDMVAQLLRVPGADRACLVQFWDSRDLYELDFDRRPPSLRLVASPFPGRGVLAVPELRQSFDHVWSKDHRERGHVHVLHRQGTDEPLVVLVDADRDGRLDRYETITTNWAESGWGDGNAYRSADERR